MALNLLKGGHELFVYGKRRLPADIRDAGAAVCGTLKAIAEASEIVILMVPDTPDVKSVLFDPDGVAEGLSPGKIVVDMSSISPIETKLFAAEINKKGCDYLDAPVSGGEVGAKAASLTIMVGGPERAFTKVNPIFELMGKNITLVGGNGDGQTTKVANQIIVALTIEAVGEAVGIEQDALYIRRVGHHQDYDFRGFGNRLQGVANDNARFANICRQPALAIDEELVPALDQIERHRVPHNPEPDKADLHAPSCVRAG